MIIVAGEAGGSIPSTRQRIEQGWGARVIDHHGLTEVGPISFECWEAPGALHLNEAEYICEILEPGSDRQVADGERGELVVTNLGRVGQPADSLSHGRCRGAPLGDVRLRAQYRAARGRHSLARRRHGERARRQRVSVCGRSRSCGASAKWPSIAPPSRRRVVARAVGRDRAGQRRRWRVGRRDAHVAAPFANRSA